MFGTIPVHQVQRKAVTVSNTGATAVTLSAKIESKTTDSGEVVVSPFKVIPSTATIMPRQAVNFVVQVHPTHHNRLYTALLVLRPQDSAGTREFTGVLQCTGGGAKLDVTLVKVGKPRL